MENTDKDYYCAAPFVNRSYDPNGKVKPCCEWHNLDTTVDDEQQLISLRSQFLQNKPNPCCKVCHKTEAAGVQSTRNDFNNRYGRPTVPVLRHLDLSLGNLCNFKCRMCSSFFSTKWASDEQALGLIPHKLYRRTWDELKHLDISNVDMIKFKGGEPFLEQETMINTLTAILSQKGSLENITVVVNTNGSIEIEPRLIELLSLCKTVNLTVSIDGYGKVNEYQRTGAVWNVIEKNLLDFQKNLNNNFDLSIWSVWTILNITNLKTLLGWVTTNLPRYKIYGTTLHFPEEFAIRNIPDQLKTQFFNDISNWRELDHNDGVLENKLQILNELQQQPIKTINEVKSYIDSLDKVRNESFSLIDPVMYAAFFESTVDI